MHQQPPCDGRKTVIVHNHVLKNAGSTIDWALHRNFGDAFVDHRDDYNMQRGLEYLGPYLAKNPWIQALSTHSLRPPMPELDDTRLMTIMMFRHPIERVASVYSFERKQVDTDTLGARYARSHNLREYVLWRMRFNVPPTIRNFHVYRALPGLMECAAGAQLLPRLVRRLMHTVYLLRYRWESEVDESELRGAMEFVNSVAMLGLVERFDESMVLFEEVLRPFFPEIDLSYVMQNVSQPRNETRDERIRRLKAEIGDDALELLVERNRADLDLYQYAETLFNERLKLLPKLKSKMDDFCIRCQRHDQIGVASVKRVR